jgi:hypothetical protein
MVWYGGKIAIPYRATGIPYRGIVWYGIVFNYNTIPWYRIQIPYRGIAPFSNTIPYHTIVFRYHTILSLRLAAIVHASKDVFLPPSLIRHSQLIN